MIINGTDGNDVLLGKTALGADTMTGKKGSDTYYVNNAGDKVIESLNQGIDTVISSITYTLAANVENLVLTGATDLNGTGNALNNTLTGNNAANTLNGLAGNDVLNGNGGNDNLNGGDGNDALSGGAGIDALKGDKGNDTYYIGSTADVITELAGQGVDTVIKSIGNYTLGSNLENLILGAGSVTGTGNELNNVLTGNAGNNTLNGLAGIDKLSGLAGNDKLNGGDGNDTLIGGEGADILTGGLGKDTYDLTETTASSDTVIVGLNTTFNINTYLADTDVVKGFNPANDKLDVPFAANIVANTAANTFITGINPDGLDFGSFARHTVSNGIYTLYANNSATPTLITSTNEKQAYGYLLENTPFNGAVAGFHVSDAAGKVTNTIIMQHNHSGTPVVENHVVVDLVGVDASLSATGGAGAVWIM
ncbi:calcium-binding protein [Crenothrix sp.]|uniref:calcium-binding protein n=1 Tax=Crenothrix sp. TaxID=3100433 RepID=UPI00374D03C2